MLFKKKKDLVFRKKFLKYEKLNKINKVVFINIVSHALDKKNSLFTFLKFQASLKKNSRVKIKTRCSISNRGSAINQYYALSRIKMREFIHLGLIPGYKKSIW